MTMRRTLSVVLGAAALGGCAEPEPTLIPIGVHITPLSNTACGDPDAPGANPNPFSDAPNISIAVRGVDSETGVFGTLLKKSGRIREGQSLRIGGVPEGQDRELVIVARGGETWYGRDTNLDITRNAPTAAGMVLTKLGEMTCVASPSDMQNVLFPAVVTLGDGRVLSVGGFTDLDTGTTPFTLGSPSPQAMLFDPRTGVTTTIAMDSPADARGAATAVYLPETNKVVVFGGAKELLIDTTKEFPLTVDAADSGNLQDDFLVFDVASGEFEAAPAGETMLAGRVFPRAARLGDGTVLVMGGGRWPIDGAEDDSHLESDIFDPEDNDGAGGFLDIPSLRGFFPRAGHSLTFLRNTEEGLTQLLIWGGTTPSSSSGGGPQHSRLGEIYKQSGRQQDGVNGTFAEVSVVGPNPAEAPNFTFFQELTRVSDTSFIATGGAPMEGNSIRAPRNDEVWRIDVQADEKPPLLIVTKIGGLSARVFHTAHTDDYVNLSVVGGWTVGAGQNFSNVDDAQSVMQFNSASNQWTPLSASARGGHGSALTSAGTILVVGGERDTTTLPEHRLVSEILTPSYVFVP